MKKVWLSSMTALTIVLCSVGYYYKKRQDLKAAEKHVAELTAPQQRSVAVVTVPVETEVDVIDEFSNPLNIDAETFDDKACCPDNEDEAFHEFSDTHKSLEITVGADVMTEEVDTTRGDRDWLRKRLIEKHGYSPDIDRYLELSKVLINGERKGLATMLEWARLEVRYNPSDDAHDLLNDFEELAENPELVTDFYFQ